MKCVICGSTRHGIFRVIQKDKSIGERIKYVKCSKCGLVFIKPQPLKKLRMKKLYPKRLSPQYKIDVLKTMKWLIPFSPWSIHLDYLKQNNVLQLGGDVLDIGTGHGRFLYLLKWRGWKVLGVDPSTRYAEFANKVLRVPTINADFEEVMLNKKFDLITMMSILEHLSDPVKSLEKVKSLMKENGRLHIVAVHVKLNKFYATHLFLFTEDTITKLMNKVGFTIESIKNIDNRIYLIAKKTS